MRIILTEKQAMQLLSLERKAAHLVLVLVLFASVTLASWSIGSLLAFEHAPWKWPASGQVALVIVVVFLTAILYGILGINQTEDDMEFDDDRR